MREIENGCEGFCGDCLNWEAESIQDFGRLRLEEIGSCLVDPDGNSSIGVTRCYMINWMTGKLGFKPAGFSMQKYGEEMLKTIFKGND